MEWAHRVRLLDPDRDEVALRTFRCARLSEPWAMDVQDAIRAYVADAVRSGRSTGFVWADGDLLAGRYLESRVHEDNQAMLSLNQSLGADMRRLPPGPGWSPSDHISCVIEL